VLLFVVLAAVGGVQFAGAAPNPAEKLRVSGKVYMGSVNPFIGKVRVSKYPRECRGPRPIRIIDADTRAVVARATTDKTGHWSKSRPFFIGRVFADAPWTLGGCPPMHASPVRRFGPAAPTGADLAITKVAIGNDGDHSAQYTVTVTNLGPAQADGVVVTDDPGTTFVATGSDPRCGPDGGTVFSCTIGTLTSGSATSLLVLTDCVNPTVNSASVASTTSDPNTANNSTGNVASGPCPS
jgi:uncharacterized repeat protein (TIGR01451 family)